MTRYASTLLVAMGCITKIFEKNTPQEQRALASTFYTLFSDIHTELQDLNSNQTIFKAVFSVTGTHKVKLLYGICYVTTGIGKVSPVSKKFLALFYEGSSTMDPAQVIIMENSTRN